MFSSSLQYHSTIRTQMGVVVYWDPHAPHLYAPYPTPTGKHTRVATSRHAVPAPTPGCNVGRGGTGMGWWGLIPGGKFPGLIVGGV